MTARVAILLLAAGAASRMRGRDKLTEEVEGAPLLRVMVARAAATGAPVRVTVPGADHPRAALVDPALARTVPVPDAGRGMGRSIAAGIAALPDGLAGAMILPADMPEITTGDLCRVRDAFAADPDAPPVQATAEDGTPGHPVLFPAKCFAALSRLDGDSGARSVLMAQGARLRRIALPARHAVTDLDTPEAWAAWRASR